MAADSTGRTLGFRKVAKHQVRALRLKVMHHHDDSVSATVLLHGKPFKYVRFTRLPAEITRAELADRVAHFAININAAIQRAFERDAAAGPTMEMEAEDEEGEAGG